ncbi:hypothetical protein PR048_015424 [Dryococelus australis]|uniref:Uncharacterized protein n=1 Tax=Dryococelus australis TaxID=614101 RepID=A0ABQ9HH28_9NEOP|nr:hypothetical protein PR048_015424 [Dryococelus australis]
MNDMTKDQLQEVKIQACFVSENCIKLVNLLELLEGKYFPTSHLLHAELIHNLKTATQQSETKLKTPQILPKIFFTHAVKPLMCKLPAFEEPHLEPQSLIEGLRLLKCITAEQSQDSHTETVDLCKIHILKLLICVKFCVV